MESKDKIETNKYSPEILNLIDNFQGELAPIMSVKYRLLEGAYERISSLLERYAYTDPFAGETRTICDNLKLPLTRLVQPGIFIDAEPNRLIGGIEVEISHQPKSKPKEIKKDGTIVAKFRPGRGDRNDVLVIGPARLQLITKYLEIDCFNSNADPDKMPKGMLAIISNEPRYGIPDGKIMIIAEEQPGYGERLKLEEIDKILKSLIGTLTKENNIIDLE